ncbi:hypothetical protein G3O00_01525 [Burkholderia sp. Ac-20384]|uniref:hypothetical protein n=1 Tax=Burkholderia sp. Ac-20384 TaxID=2703902 RepID=UPI0019805D74|nr:hypothetical protein [Burkholderia sp. Ac-20384]MBN3822298.1 hypothetical protein [Burkholderia sp. Ac-20384]
MKNIPVSRSRQPETVALQDLVDAMLPGHGYTQDEVCDLMPDRPRSAVRDTLNTLVGKGLIWRDASESRVRYSLPDCDALRAAIEHKATPPQQSFGAPLTGYDASIRKFRELCMVARFF